MSWFSAFVTAFCSPWWTFGESSIEHRGPFFFYDYFSSVQYKTIEFVDKVDNFAGVFDLDEGIGIFSAEALPDFY